MWYGFLADVVVLVHFLFVLFVILGGFIVLRWIAVAWLHLPAVAWGAYVEITGRICPLTPLENWLRFQGGEAGYHGDFIVEYLVPLLYPTGLARDVQLLMGGLVLLLNSGVYAWLLLHYERRSKRLR